MYANNNPNTVLNPNQRQQLEDERRLQDKLQGLNKNGNRNSQSYIRKENIEEDVNILDKYDSFYYTTKSLLVMFQIMGIMPIMRTPRGVQLPRTTFHFCSKAFYWAYLIYGLETIVVVWGKEEQETKSGINRRFKCVAD